MKPRTLLQLVVALPTLAFAHGEPPPHDCARPVRPPDKTDDVVWNAFVDRMDAYRGCMSTFIEANHQAADHHRAAANAATDEWNEFVRTSLNVPEDFPWPAPEPMRRHEN